MPKVDILPCIMPWKAFYMDDYKREMVALPCCANWINYSYGNLQNNSISELWNSEKAQYIRKMISEGNIEKVCSKNCPYLYKKDYSEVNLRIIQGPEDFIRNQKLNNEEIKQRRIILQSKPMLFKLVPTLKCQLRCKMCFQNSSAEPNLYYKFYQDFFNLLPYLYEVTFQGGEILSSVKFKNFISNNLFLNQLHIQISLLTNGTNLPEIFIKTIRKLKVNYILISLNAATRETYKHITGKDLFNQVLKNVQKLKNISKRYNFTIFLSFLIMTLNYFEIEKFIELCNIFGVSFKLAPALPDNPYSIINDKKAWLNVKKDLEKCEKTVPKELIDELRWIRSVYK